MVKVIGPALSLDASKSLGKTLTYQRCPSGTRMYLYKKPGDRVAFIPSWKQRNQRGIGGLILARWQSMTAVEQAVWNDEARDTGFQGSGYNLFYKKANTNLYYYLGLCGYWSFNEGSGCRTLDLSGQGNHGDLKPTCPTNSPLWVEGQNSKFGKALNFNNNSVYCGYSRFYPTTGSMFLWAKMNNYAATDYECLIMAWASDNNRIFIEFYNNQTMRFYYGAGGSYKLVQINVSAYKGYHLLGMTWDKSGDKLKAFVDGVQAGSTTTGLGTFTGTVSRLYVGDTAETGLHAYYLGLIDEVCIFNRALPDLEILRHYQMFRKSY